MAGSLDFVAREEILSCPGVDIEKMGEFAEDKMKADVVFCRIDLGIHSNYEDEIYIGDTPLAQVVRMVGRASEFFSFPLERFLNLVTQGVKYLEKMEARSEQIEISIELATYWLQEGMQGM